MKYTAINTMLSGLSMDNGLIPIDEIELKLRQNLSEEELLDMGRMNANELPWRQMAEKAGLDKWEQSVLSGIMELAYGECVRYDGKIML